MPLELHCSLLLTSFMRHYFQNQAGGFSHGETEALGAVVRCISLRAIGMAYAGGVMHYHLPRHGMGSYA